MMAVCVEKLATECRTFRGIFKVTYCQCNRPWADAADRARKNLWKRTSPTRTGRGD